MQSIGCFPAAFVVVLVAVFATFGGLQQDIYVSGIDLNLNWVVVALALVLAAGVVFFWRRRRSQQDAGSINRP
jgi:LPXTG-motif cell wall-anchored protein